MGAQVVDYRVSTLVVLCKDCGQDVGLYPARHKCGPIERPAMPALPTKYLDQKQQSRTPSLDSTSKTISSASSSSTSPSVSSAEAYSSSKWSSRLGKNTPAEEVQQEESIYLNNFTASIPGSDTTASSGKKLWGKVRQNDKWKQLNEKNDKPKQTGKLWGKLLQATQNIAEKIPNRDEKGAESDEDDCEGETHVSRIVREYYEKKRLPLPEWLFDDNTPMQRNPSSRQKSPTPNSGASSAGPMRTPSRRKLWDNSEKENSISSRERERQELRKNQSVRKPPSNVNDDYGNDHYDNDNRPDRARSLRGDRLNRARSERSGKHKENDYYQEDRQEPIRHEREDRYKEDYHQNREDVHREDRYREDRYRDNRSNENSYRDNRSNESSYRDNRSNESSYRDNRSNESSYRDNRSNENNYRDDHQRYREENNYQSKSVRRDPPPSRYEDKGYYDRPRSPPRQYKEHTRQYDDYHEPSKYSNTHSDRYTDRNDLDDYYYDSAPRNRAPTASRERSRQEPPVRNDRYDKSSGYF